MPRAAKLMRAIVGGQIIQTGQVIALCERAGSPQQRCIVYGDLSIGENLRYFAAILDVDAWRIAQVTAIVGPGTSIRS
jgi:ABC-2 type transport system ATP-binding protein